MSRPYAALRTLVLLLLAGLCLHAYAQEPLDSEAWKQRCTTLSASSAAIDRGAAPPELVQTPKGIAGAKFEAVAHERGTAGQHYIACTLYFTAAIAEYAGTGGRVQPSKAHTDINLATMELKRATGQPLTFKEKMGNTSHGMKTMTTGSLTPADINAVFGVFGPDPNPTTTPAH